MKILILLLLSLPLSSIGQVDLSNMGMGMGATGNPSLSGNPNGMSGNPMGGFGDMGSMNSMGGMSMLGGYQNGMKRNLDLSFLKNQGQCAFEPQLSADDQTLLNNADRAVKLLRENDKCTALSTQFNAFQTAMQAYNQKAGADRGVGYDGSVAVNCSNYEHIYDLEYDYFLNTWDGVSSDMMDPYAVCRGKTQAEALTCAAKVTGNTKALKKKECDKLETAVNRQQKATIVADTYRTGLQAMQAILMNDNCLDATGSQRLSFIQAAVGLAGRAASLGAAGGPAGLLIGAATDVIGSVFNKLFSSSVKSKDNLAILENRNNFTKLACLYEKLEDKSLRCDRLLASQELEGTAKAFDEAQACIMNSHQDVLAGNNIIKDLGSIIETVNKQTEKETPSSALTQEVFDSLAQKLSAPYPGTKEPILDLSAKASEDVAKELSEAMASDQSLKKFLEKSGKSGELTGSQLRQAKTQLEKDLKRVKSVSAVLKAIKDADAKGTQMSGADLENVMASFKSYQGNPQGFVSDYNATITFKAGLDSESDLGKMIKTNNLKMSEAAMFQQVINRITAQRQVASADFQDNGNFNEARAAMRPHLKKLLDQELDTLSRRAESLRDIQPGTPSTVMKEQMQTREEEIIYPLLRACNQLRSVMNYDGSDFDTTAQHDGCKAFSCPRGSRSFQDYLNDKKVQGNDMKDCQSTSCQGHYSRYICQERKKLDSIRSQLKNEFLTKGTLCGRPLSQAFKN